MFSKIIRIIAITGIAAIMAAAQGPVDHQLAEKGVNVIPERFLRSYDPITVFFNKPTGPAQVRPLDEPGDLLTLEPEHPGAYRWLDAKTLQFQPAAAWPPLARYRVTSQGKTFQLLTLMAAPTLISPASGNRNLEPVEEINLSFSDRMPLELLAEMISFEVRTLPGTEPGYRLTKRDFSIKELARTGLQQPMRYQLAFHKPIPFGKRLTMTLRLSADPDFGGSLVSYHFYTKPLFRLVGAGSDRVVYPIAAEGSVYTFEQALNCGSGNAPFSLVFSDQLGELTLDQVKRLVRFEPAVGGLRHEVNGKRLDLYFEVAREQTYRAFFEHVPIRGKAGRTLSGFGETSLYFFYEQPESFLSWGGSKGIMERFGPLQYPMEGRGDARVDVRVYKIDPTDRNFWPFPDSPIAVDEQQRPPGPGEEPAFAADMHGHISLLGMPLVSRVVPLTYRRESGDNHFNLDLKPLFERVSGADAPGTYLVGLRRIGGDTTRHYARVQVTDLCLSTVEDESSVAFLVTSLQTGKPVAGARVAVEGVMYKDDEWRVLLEGVTDAAGLFLYRHSEEIKARIARIHVALGDDHLVLDPNVMPPNFMNNHWFNSYGTWLGWLASQPVTRKNEPVKKAHLLTERPVYRPEEPVHIKGYVRIRTQGLLSPAEETKHTLRINGPGGKLWTYPVTLDAFGSFYFKFDEAEPPTGDYLVVLADEKGENNFGFVRFRKEAYRIPRFEINFIGPEKAPNDRPFEVGLNARYYAGGPVVGQSVTWNVSQFPYTPTPAAFKGFLFSTDSRFSGGAPFRSTGEAAREDQTDDTGGATLELDPSGEIDGRARRYVIEATVRGADEQTVSNTKTVLALPPIVLGLKLDRVLKDSLVIKPQFVVLGHDHEPLEGQEVRLRLLQRQWHSYLEQSDFTTGKARYVTDVVDQQVLERNLTSSAGAMDLELPVEEAGVYIVEIAAKDRLGRLQKVSADLYVAGEGAVAWSKPKDNVFETTLDQGHYKPDETATLLLKSPFQRAEALVVVEAPDRNRYHWVTINQGQGIFELPIEGAFAPRVAVHTLLMRGRVGDAADFGDGRDRNGPIAMGNTAWVNVRPGDKRINAKLAHQEKVRPGSSVEIAIELTDDQEQPVSGQAVLWLVDRAVLALGTEAELDPVPSFLDQIFSTIRLRDTRNHVIGAQGDEDRAGGGGELADEALFDKVTVRKNFQPVPYFNADIRVTDGRAVVTVPMPDNLTDFAVRVVAVDRASRFGFAKSRIAVRLPVIVQPALPRFVRPGDSFQAGAIARLVEGDEGAGVAELQVEGLTVDGELKRSLTWSKGEPQQLYFPFTVSRPASLGAVDNYVVVRVAGRREHDGASDAFEVKLPIKRDRDWQTQSLFALVEAGQPVAFPSIDAPTREGSATQFAVVAREAAVVRMLAGLNYLSEYPHGCTEQRVSRLLPALALREMLDTLGTPERAIEDEAYLKETFLFLESALQSNGLYAYWPGGDGYVHLTAYVVQFLLEARNRGYSYKPELLAMPVRALRESLRSDSDLLLAGHGFRERAMALNALAMVGEFDEAYAGDLATRSRSLDLASEALITRTLLDKGDTYRDMTDPLIRDLWNSLIFKLRDGEEVYGGLQYRSPTWDGPLHGSEVAAMASVGRALYRHEPENPKLQPLVDELIQRGAGDGWGSTHATASALLALNEVLKLSQDGPAYRYRVRFGDEETVLDAGNQVVARIDRAGAEQGSLMLETLPEGVTTTPPMAWLTTRYMPAAGGDTVAPQNEGFVVDREILHYSQADAPPIKHAVAAGESLRFKQGDVLEEHVTIINPEDRYYVALTVPFAAGLEPMNPRLATASREAKPVGVDSLEATYVQFSDDQVTYYYDQLPKGTYQFYFRVRATTAGSFVHPPASAEMMYKQAVRGGSAGARLAIEPRTDSGQ